MLLLKSLLWTVSIGYALAFIAPSNCLVRRAGNATPLAGRENKHKAVGNNEEVLTKDDDKRRPPLVESQLEEISYRRQHMEQAINADPAARAALWDLRGKMEQDVSVDQLLSTLAQEVADQQDLLSTEASIILERCPKLTALAKEGTLVDALVEAGMSWDEDGYFLLTLRDEVMKELDTPWDVAVKKWRQKALAVEKYGSTNPVYVASIYTYMVNTCLRQKKWNVAYDAMAYAGVLSAGPFFLSEVDIGSMAPALVLDLDKMAAYIAEKILDMDLDAWRRLGGDAEAGAGTVGNNKPGVGIEERNFAQNEDSTSVMAGLRVQDMTLAATRVALRMILTKMADGDFAKGADIVLLCSARADTSTLGELLLPPRPVIALLALDFPLPLPVDGAGGDALSKESVSILGIDRGRPIVIRGADAMDWLEDIGGVDKM
ncbi:unnamed protein product [Choristocarpus tenellus]